MMIRLWAAWTLLRISDATVTLARRLLPAVPQ